MRVEDDVFIKWLKQELDQGRAGYSQSFHAFFSL